MAVLPVRSYYLNRSFKTIRGNADREGDLPKFLFLGGPQPGLGAGVESLGVCQKRTREKLTGLETRSERSMPSASVHLRVTVLVPR